MPNGHRRLGSEFHTSSIRKNLHLELTYNPDRKPHKGKVLYSHDSTVILMIYFTIFFLHISFC